MSNLVTRAITGAFFVIILIGSVLISQYTFIALFGIITVFSAIEFLSLFNRSETRGQLISGTLLSIFIYLMASLILFEVVSFKWLLLIVPFTFLVLIGELYRGREHPFQNAALTILSSLYIAAPFSLFIYFAFINGTYQPNFIIGIFILIWTNDTFAYLVGRQFGKTKLFYRISPKKTIEGSFGGAVVTLIAGGLISKWLDVLGFWDWLVLALIVVIFASLGDLIESMLKRSLNVKDTGNILPGHGGLLDRFDALIGVAPFIFTYLLFTGRIL